MGLVKKELNRKEIAVTAVFGAVWGLLEVTAGTALQVAKVPLRGVIMAFFAGMLLTGAKEFLPWRGSLILLGAIAASLKVAAMGGFVPTPVAAILLEAALAEAVFYIAGYRLLSAMAAGAAVLFYTIVHASITHIFFFGFDIFRIYKAVADEFSSLLGFGNNAWVAILILFIVLNLALGMISGTLGYRIGEKTRIKLNTSKQEKTL